MIACSRQNKKYAGNLWKDGFRDFPRIFQFSSWLSLFTSEFQYSAFQSFGCRFKADVSGDFGALDDGCQHAFECGHFRFVELEYAGGIAVGSRSV